MVGCVDRGIKTYFVWFWWRWVPVDHSALRDGSVQGDNVLVSVSSLKGVRDGVVESRSLVWMASVISFRKPPRVGGGAW